jgi:hypothetical protein
MNYLHCDHRAPFTRGFLFGYLPLVNSSSFRAVETNPSLLPLSSSKNCCLEVKSTDRIFWYTYHLYTEFLRVYDGRPTQTASINLCPGDLSGLALPFTDHTLLLLKPKMQLFNSGIQPPWLVQLLHNGR